MKYLFYITFFALFLFPFFLSLNFTSRTGARSKLKNISCHRLVSAAAAAAADSRSFFCSSYFIHIFLLFYLLYVFAVAAAVAAAPSSFKVRFLVSLHIYSLLWPRRRRLLHITSTLYLYLCICECGFVGTLWQTIIDLGTMCSWSKIILS